MKKASCQCAAWCAASRGYLEERKNQNKVRSCELRCVKLILKTFFPRALTSSFTQSYLLAQSHHRPSYVTELPVLASATVLTPPPAVALASFPASSCRKTNCRIPPWR